MTLLEINNKRQMPNTNKVTNGVQNNGLPARILDCWLPVICLDKLGKKPVKRIIANYPIVIWRTGTKDVNGDEIIMAAFDRCPHRNYPLSDGKVYGGNLICPYHGWEFDADGDCAKIPGTCQDIDGKKYRLEKLKTKIIQNAVFVIINPKDDINPDDTLPPLTDEGDFDYFWWEIKPKPARVYDALDNVLDPFHTNFIHDGYIRVKNKRQKVLQTIEVFKNSFRATYEQDADYGWMSRALEGKRDKSIGQYYPPICFQGRWLDLKGLNHCVTSWFVPDETGKMRTMLHFAMAKRRGPKWLKILLVRLFLFNVIQQDADALQKMNKNIADFGVPKFKIGPDDRLSAYLTRLYEGHELSEGTHGPFEIML